MPGKPLRFTIATCNVLYEPYYVQYVEEYPISIQKRCNVFKKALNNPEALKDLDIICFQEWPVKPGSLRKQFEQEEVIVEGKKITKIGMVQI